MLFFESLARPLLVMHAVSAAVLVGATTHHVIWSRHYARKNFGRIKAERTFALVGAIAFVCTFLIGNMLYPTYKVRVRAEYFDNPQAIADELKLRAAGHQTTHAMPVEPRAATLGSVARLFDIKEHWVALGCSASVILLILSRLAHPREFPRTTALYLGLSAFACGAAWFGAVVGLVTASYRAVGGAT